jgi:hypothetical protein
MKTGGQASTRARVRRGVSFSAAVAATLAVASTARASTLDASGHLVFDKSALLTLGFESVEGAEAEGASWMSWDATYTGLVAKLVAEGTWASSSDSLSGASGVVSLPDALEGTHALKLTVGRNVAFGLVDTALFKSLTSKRLEVSFWGYSTGAEPELDVVYPSTDQPVGPWGFGHLVAVRTGRETSDGWAEYSTGPIDGQFFGNDPVAAILLTARFSTPQGITALDSFDLVPPEAETVLDTSAYALADAIEVVSATGSPVPVVSCTQATVATSCGPLGECTFGHCASGSAIWGIVPPSSADRTDLVERWAFISEHLLADRGAAARAESIFSTSAISTVAGAADAPGFYGGLNTLVNELRDGHTGLGVSPSTGTNFYEGLSSSDSYSGLLDVCFGLAQDDLPGGTGEPVYAVFWMAPSSALGSALGGDLLVGDMLTEIDGLSPDAWLDTVGARFREKLPNDPASEPAARALLLGEALPKYASTATFSSCTAAGACTTKPFQVGDIAYESLTGTKYASATRDSRLCSGRFTDSVPTWTPADDELVYDVPQFASAGGITSVEFDGFEGAYDGDVPSAPYHAWETPMEDALTSGQNVLFDARLGHGGLFVLGKYLAHQIRSTSDPYFTFAMPRGTWDDIDPTWLFDPSLSMCLAADPNAPDMCGWTGGQIDAPTLASPPGAAVKIAWVNARDLSMNDIVPRELLGATNLKVFGPHPSSGAYGEISDIPAYVTGWIPGSIQVLDMRFGSSFPTAVAAPWESGTGVPPDQVVLQDVSDILNGTDTVLTAARAWLAP